MHFILLKLALKFKFILLLAPQRNAQGVFYDKEPIAPVHITIPHSSGFSDKVRGVPCYINYPPPYIDLGYIKLKLITNDTLVTR